MRMIQVLFTMLILSTAALSFAADKDGDAGKGGHKGACKAFFAVCKDDATVKAATDKKAKHEAMKACVDAAAAADATNGPACAAAMAKKH